MGLMNDFFGKPQDAEYKYSDQAFHIGLAYKHMRYWGS